MVCCSAPFVIGGELLPWAVARVPRSGARAGRAAAVLCVGAAGRLAVCGLPVMPEAAACIRSVRMDPATMRSRMLSPSAMRPIGDCRIMPADPARPLPELLRVRVELLRLCSAVILVDGLFAQGVLADEDSPTWRCCVGSSTRCLWSADAPPRPGGGAVRP